MNNEKQEKGMIFLSAYKSFWANYAIFESVTSKAAFWEAWFIHNLIIIALFLPVNIPYQYLNTIDLAGMRVPVIFIPCMVYAILTIVPVIALIIRRLHDTERSGLWILAYLIPVIGTVVFFVMLSRPSATAADFFGQSQSAWDRRKNPYGLPQPATYQSNNTYGLPVSAEKGAVYGQRQHIPASRISKGAVYGQRQHSPASSGGVAIVLSIILLAAGIGIGVDAQNSAYRYYDTVLAKVFPGWGPFNVAYFSTTGQWPNSVNFDGTVLKERLAKYINKPEYYTDEQKALKLIRDGHVDGFPEYTIEEVLLSRLNAKEMDWVANANGDGKYPENVKYYVEAYGFEHGFSDFVYAAFDVHTDGTFELYAFSVDKFGKKFDIGIDSYREAYRQISKRDPAWDAEKEILDDQWAAISYVKESCLDGFPDATIEDVMLTHAGASGLKWESSEGLGGDSSRYSVSCDGLDTDLPTAYFHVYDDGTINFDCLSLYVENDDSSDDVYNFDVLGTYQDWYDGMDRAKGVN